MKATKFFALAFSLLAVSCTNELVDDSIEQNKNYEDGIVLTLTGDAQKDAADTRIIIDGSQTGGKYNVKWRNEDAIGIFSADGTTINNVKAAETTVASGGKATTASFDTEVKVPATEGDEIVVYYPYNAAASYANGKFTANLAASQETNDLTIAYGFAPYTLAYDVATVEEGNVNFALQHPLAYVKVQVEATDYVKNWKLKGVQIVDRTGNAKLAGDYTVDTATGEITVTNGTSSVDQYFKYVTNTIANTSNYDTRYITLVTLPCDFTGSEVWVVAKFEDPTTSQMIYVPTKYENVQLKGGAFNVIKLTLTAESQSAKGWYEPIDTRLMPGLGYAYGDQNTYLIQCKNGSTYTGATYTPNANIPNAVKVDIRGRGDFSKIVDVTKAKFEWYKKGVMTNGNGTGDVYVPQTQFASTSAINSTAFTIDDSTKAEGYITVTNTGAYAGAPILLMIVDNKVVWSWAFWNIAADGTALEEVKYGDYTLANMAIGQPTTNMDTWKSTTEVIWQYVHLYQWGRTMPTYKRSYNSFYDAYKNGGSGHIPVIRTEPMTLAESVQYPVGQIISTAVETEQKKWCSEDLYLWGGSEKNEARVGVKTVFDPCPKGWKVMDVAVANYMKDNATAAYTSTAAVIGSSLTAGGTSSYWIIGGRFDPKTNSGNNQLASDSTGKYWTNYLEGGGNTASAGYVLTVYKNNNKPTRNTHPRAASMAVRCQKDADNR